MSQILMPKPIIHQVYQDNVSVGTNAVVSLAMNWFVLENSINDMIIGSTSKSIRMSIDDTESRKQVWKIFFGSRQMPAQEQDAIKKYAGVLGTDIEITDDDIENALRIAKEK